MSDELEDDEIMLLITPRKFRKWDMLAVGLQTVSSVVQALADGTRDAAGVLLRHSEYEQMQTMIHEDMAIELETLISEVENGTAL